MNILHILLEIIQIACAIGLIVAVTSQTSKESGMGAAFGGGDNTGNTRYTGGAEEKIENLTRNLAYSFLILSLLVAVVATKLV